uniref:Uncharacterized protein n=1 Tax=Rhizophora mucronata TaxID=61149 RepID=A0A2P2ITJ4_RHIMU
MVFLLLLSGFYFNLFFGYPFLGNCVVGCFCFHSLPLLGGL